MACENQLTDQPPSLLVDFFEIQAAFFDYIQLIEAQYSFCMEYMYIFQPTYCPFIFSACNKYR